MGIFTDWMFSSFSPESQKKLKAASGIAGTVLGGSAGVGAGLLLSRLLGKKKLSQKQREYEDIDQVIKKSEG